jgi:hypothetical protein
MPNTKEELLEYYAGCALTGLLASPDRAPTWDEVVERAFTIAEKMVDERGAYA